MNDFKVNIEALIKYNLTLEEYFILYCLFYNKPKILLDFYKNGKHDLEQDIYEKLENLGYIKLTDPDKVTFKTIEFQDKIKQLFSFDSVEMLEWQFQDFLNNYPKMVREGKKRRRLHSDLSRCKKLYIGLLTEVSHEDLCRCARLYHKEMRDGGNEIYMQGLDTWLHQKNYTQYLDEVEQPKQEGGFIDDL
jgi:hypothetical protein